MTLAEAFFRFDYPPYPETFVFKLTAPSKIAEARAILSQGATRHIMGKILRFPAGYNPPWSYHLDPDSISFFTAATEVCDSTIQQVEDRLGEACGVFLPNCDWCPWGSRLIAELGAPPPATPTTTPAFVAYLPMVQR